MATMRGPLAGQIIGADVGNATTTAVTSSGAMAFFPSLLGSFGVSAYQGVARPADGMHHLSHDGRHALIGLEAADVPGRDTLLTDLPETEAWRRYTSPESLMCLLTAVCAALPGAASVGVRLATGAPLSLAQPYGDTIRQALIGAHEVAYNGQPRRVVVEDARVFAEGAELARLLTDEQRRGNVAIHDVGGRTWNVLLYRDGRLLGSRTFGLGVDRILDSISLVSSDPVIRWHLMGELRSGGKTHAAIRQQFAAQVAAALGQIERKVSLSAARRHVVAGGAAALIAPALQRAYKAEAVVLCEDAPETANARAYLAAGAEVWG